VKDIRIASLGYYIPPGRIDNDAVVAKVKQANAGTLFGDDLELLGYSCRRKFEFLGIDTRSAPIDPAQDNFVTMAVKAAKKALSAMENPGDPIDCVIISGISNPFKEPSGACIVAHELGFDIVDHFDVSDTCNGFLKAIEIAGLYIESKEYRRALVVTCENPFELERGMGMNITVKTVDEMDSRLSNLILGAGAAAAVVQEGRATAQERAGRRILRYRNRKETAHWDSSLVRIPHTSLPATKYGRPIDGFWADARGMSAELIRANPAFVKECLDEWRVDKSKISHVVLHQLGNNITFAILDKLGFPHDIAPVNTFREYGNMGTVNIPVNLAVGEERGHLKKGDLVLLVNSACGFTHSAALIEW
jgi:3-oxoacyl-[acyl-carrier-protein] synthase-3